MFVYFVIVCLFGRLVDCSLVDSCILVEWLANVYACVLVCLAHALVDIVTYIYAICWLADLLNLCVLLVCLLVDLCVWLFIYLSVGWFVDVFVGCSVCCFCVFSDRFVGLRNCWLVCWWADSAICWLVWFIHLLCC